MKIIFNASCIQQPLTGIGHFAYQNLKALQTLLKDDLISYHFNEPQPATSSKKSKMSAYKKIAMQLPLAYQINRLIKNYRFSKFSNQHPADVYFEPNFVLFKSKLPSVPCIYDLSFIRHPETHPKYRRNIFKRYLKKTIDKSKAIVTISEFSKAEMVDIFKVDPNKIHVAYCGASEHFKPRNDKDTKDTLQQYGLEYRKFILVIGTFEPRKNLIRTCEAYAELPDNLRKAYPLVLCGASGWGQIKLSDAVKNLIEKQEIKILQYVSNQALYELTSAAKLSCYASIYEGFGLPVLEAMQSATPVITSNVSSMPEVAGHATLLVNPFEVDDIAKAMQKLLEDEMLCQKLTLDGLEQAKKFSWENTAKVIIKACQA